MPSPADASRRRIDVAGTHVIHDQFVAPALFSRSVGRSTGNPNAANTDPVADIGPVSYTHLPIIESIEYARLANARSLLSLDATHAEAVGAKAVVQRADAARAEVEAARAVVASVVRRRGPIVALSLIHI